MPVSPKRSVGGLPIVPQARLDVRPINWSGLPRRYMNLGELEVLIALMRSVGPRHVIEFGVNTGRTAKAILANVPGIERYTGIDVTPDYVPACAVQINEVPARPGWMVKDDPRFELMVRPRGSLDLVADDFEPCQAVFIDGDHGAEAVKHDTALARALVAEGIIVWHDYHELGTVDVKAVLDDMRQDGMPIFRVARTWLAYQRV